MVVGMVCQKVVINFDMKRRKEKERRAKEEERRSSKKDVHSVADNSPSLFEIPPNLTKEVSTCRVDDGV
jgi:hypothetical protein